MAQAKGRRPLEHLLFTKGQVARTLMLPVKAINQMISQGILQPVTPEGKKPMFHASDIAAVLSVIEDKVHLSKIWNHTLVAYERSARNERKIEEIVSLLGASEKTLPLEQEAIEKLFDKISKLLGKDLHFLSAEEILEWARTFLAMDQHYLVTAAHFLQTKEPWHLPLLFGHRMLEHAPRDLYATRKDLEHVYSYFEWAFRSFKHEAYFYCRVLTGSAKSANLKFPDARDGNVTRAITKLIRMAVQDNIPAHLESVPQSLRQSRRSMH